MEQGKATINQNGIDWNLHKPLIDTVCRMIDSKNVDIQQGMKFLHMFMIWKANYRFPIHNQTMNLYYQLIGAGAVQVAMEEIDKIFHKINVLNKEGAIIKRIWPNENNKTLIT